MDTPKRVSVATDMESAQTMADDREIGHVTHHMERGSPINLADVEEVSIEIRDLKVTVDTKPSLLRPGTYGALFQQFTSRSKPSSVEAGDDESGSAQPDTDGKKTLIHSVSASIAPGTLTAIIGGSGSGKTTLLNTLSERISSNRLKTTGQALFNGSEDVGACRHAYVMQQDILLPSLTVRETLEYAADLRLPPPCTPEDRRRVVQEVIMELGLKECADTRIGDSKHKGASGGEKRRTSIGVQLLSNPSVLFLDEPTTGLDATSAFQLVMTLKTLASKGRTIITTIHQPRGEIWSLFDSIVVLSRGSPVYIGPRAECVPWLEKNGLKMGDFVNPAEWVIDCAAIDARSPQLEAQSSLRVARLKEAWAEKSNQLYGPLISSNEDHLSPVLRRRDYSASSKKRTLQAPFTRQLRVLTSRTVKVTYRDPMGMAAAIMEGVLMGIVCGYIFFDLPLSLSGIRSRQGAMYTATGLQGYLFLIFEVYRLTIDIPVFDRENNEGCVSPLPWMLSRRIARFATEDIPVPFLFSVIFYFMGGFDRDVEKFFTFFAIVLVNHYIAVTCAMTCVAATRGFPGASLIANLAFTLQSMACGYFIQVDTIPVYVRWLKWITYSFYVFSALCTNEFAGGFYDCPAEPSSPDNPQCIEYTGNFILNALGFPENWLWRPIIVAMSFVVFFFILSFIGLGFFQVHVGIARPKPGNEENDLSAGKENIVEKKVNLRAIDLGIDRYQLVVEKRTGWKRQVQSKTILNPTTAMFRAGELNVIMGPSGSGKTSLLNAVAGRLVDRPGMHYQRSGQVTFNGAVPSDEVVRSVASFVAQDDDALLPSLTVRETLRYAALLRLPSFIPKRTKIARAEEVMLSMGLKDCADILVGNHLLKGISGGEKRRVSIAVQILTDPRILLLDEPTSGLDAFTAGSIVEVLHGLAKEGRTIIFTIHQARSDLWHHFGNILLLARGGSAVYAGKTEYMLDWFAGLGYTCPRHTNPADFALDLVTVDLRRQDAEEQSRAKVDRLIATWDNEVTIETNRVGSKNKTKLQGIKEESATKEDEGKEVKSISRASLEQQRSHIPPPRHSFARASLSTPAELGALVREPAPFSMAFPILLSRSFLNLRRQPELVMARIMQVLGLAIVLTLFFAPLKNNYESVQTRVGFIQEVGAFYFIGMLQNVAVYPAERDVAYSEHLDGVYGPTLFLVVYTLLELPLEILTCAIFGIMGVFAVGLDGDGTPIGKAKMWGFLSLATFAIVSAGESLGIMFNSLFADHEGFAINLMGIFLAVAQTMQGILSIDMPALLEGANWLAPTRYAPKALGPPSLRGVEFTCKDEQKIGGQCPIQRGEQVIDLYNLDETDENVAIGAMLGVAVAYRFLAWLLLIAVRGSWKRWLRKSRGTQPETSLEESNCGVTGEK